MDRRTFLRNTTTVAMAGVAAAVVPAVAVDGKTVEQPVRRQRVSRIPNVSVTTHAGKVANFYDELIKGKTVLLNFFYTSCTDICPSATYNLSRVQKLLGERVGKDIFIYSLSLDPTKDTPERIRAYAEHFGAGRGWTFLTGTAEHMELLRQRLGFVDPEPELDKDKTNHIGILRFGIEPLERWSAMPILSNPAALVRSINRLMPRQGSPKVSV